MSLLGGKVIGVSREYHFGKGWKWKVVISDSRVKTIQERFDDTNATITDEDRRRLALYYRDKELKK